MTAVPVTPCSAEEASAFLERRFGPEAAKAIDVAGRAGTIRAARIVELRRCGELRHAERYGWLSLAGWLLGLGPRPLGRIDPTSSALGRGANARDVLPEPLGTDPPPDLVAVGDTGLETSDPRDPLGWAVLRLAVAAVTEAVVELDGVELGAGAVAGSLRDRIEVMARG